MLIFDEYDEYHRAPQGAITSEHTLSLRVLVRQGQCDALDIIYKRDGGEALIMPMTCKYIKGGYDVFEGSITPDSIDLYWFCFRLTINGELVYYDRSGLSPHHTDYFQLTVYAPDYTTPDWVKGGIMYHIFVDRFFRVSDNPYIREGGTYRADWGGLPSFLPDDEGIVHNRDFFGGSLGGVIEKLPYLHELGVTIIYLSPIFDANSNHKYDTGDYKKIDPGFGYETTFTLLCSEAQKLGIRIILDGVFNHVGTDSLYFNKDGHYDSIGAYQSKDSPYYDWFSFDEWNDEYDCWWGIRLLPALNKSSETLHEYIAGENGVINHWMSRGASGWRLDVVDELPDEFLDPICKAARRSDPNAFIVGEVWEDASNKIAYSQRRRYLLGNQLDSVMNYPLKDAIISFVRGGDASELAGTMAMLKQNYPLPALNCMMNIIGTHDTMRILTVLGGDSIPSGKEELAVYKLSASERELGILRLKIASALQFTLPGIPCVFYGDEAGVEGGGDPFCRTCYPWGEEDPQLMEWYRMLASIRRRIAEFAEGRYNLLWARGGVFAFARGEAENVVVIAVNLTDTEQKLDVGGNLYEWISGTSTQSCIAPPKDVVIYTLSW